MYDLETLKPWVQSRISKLLGFEEEAVVAVSLGCLDRQLSQEAAEEELRRYLEDDAAYFVRKLYSQASKSIITGEKRKANASAESEKKRPKIDDGDGPFERNAGSDVRNGKQDEDYSMPGSASVAIKHEGRAETANLKTNVSSKEPPKEKPKEERRKRRWDDDGPNTSTVPPLVSSIAAQVSSRLAAAGIGSAAKPGSTSSPTAAPVLGNVQAALEALEKAKKAALMQKQIQEQLRKVSGAVPIKADPTATKASSASSSSSAAEIAGRLGPALSPAAVPVTRPSAQAAAGAGSALSALGLSAGLAVAARLDGRPAFGLGGERFIPPPLILDDQGREVGPSGAPMGKKPTVSSVATLKANINRRKMATFKVETPKLETDPHKNPYFDPRVSTAKMARPKRSFQFVEQGRYIKYAEKMRAKALVEQYFRERKTESTSESEVRSAGSGGDENPNLIQIGPRKMLDGLLPSEVPAEPVPAQEWWDEPILVGGKYSVGEDGAVVVREENITIYVQHPVAPQPPAEAPAPPPKPLVLTKKERKKLRTRNRLEAEKERQDKIRLGLMPPPPPKVKMSNLMRVLGSEAVADPTKIEAEVKAQVEQRLKDHEDRNAARKLSAEERREKKKRKLMEDTSVEIHVSVFRVDDLANKQRQYKVDINAQQNYLTGCVVIHDAMNLVVVEGGPKALKRYSKLMLRRIDWNASTIGDEDEEEEDNAKTKKLNRCCLVWQGTVKKANFSGFRFETCKTESAARDYLKKFSVEHYWDLAKNFVAE